MKKITAKFNSKCAETGRPIRKGEEMIYDYSGKKCYSFYSQAWHNFNKDSGQFSDDSKMVQANEDAFYDNFCQQNNI